MKIVFLDFDGVIRLSDGPPSPKSFRFNSEKIELVKELVQFAQAKLVVTSTWRELYGLERMIAEMNHAFQISDFNHDWMTPLLSVRTRKIRTEVPRGAEITTWLFVHSDIERYAILDDLSEAQFKGH
ncbi:HAD domain-containing protein [Algisphaera agarilytica]|uniref:Putative GTPase n=1 Tax=Algisphaera agarilytica TaxID=1385975 RepID=A0A7X0LJY9_9BACT|nr:HAD domain-containing protein [Algisphaera agarilytica]MBB6428418.1 putative GTPase [Algisphaera agarilytica]